MALSRALAELISTGGNHKELAIMGTPKMNPERWARVKQVLDSALVLGPKERDGYLAVACIDDPSLRSEVESLLHAQAQSPDSFMKTGEARSSLSRGTKLESYDIIELIGAGGMGEVYRARDFQLRRDVAIKVLPPMFALDAERLRRFEQEARAAAALNHVNILAIYHLGRHNDQPFIVSEFLQGHTLREELSRGALPVGKAIDYGLQIARGLAAAHEKGIVHRDLKPENIFVKKDGQLKILDFGLAKLRPPGSDHETRTSPDTQSGMIMGTLAYMSPEQVRGQEADQRADIFALGTILYEMFSGQRTFRGNSTADVIGAILKEQPPDFAALQVSAPPALNRVVKKCLAKEPDERWQCTADLREELKWIAEDPQLGLPAFAIARDKTRERFGWLLAAIVLAALAGVAVTMRIGARTAVAPRPAARFVVAAPKQLLLDFYPVVSPDGKQIVFSASENGQTQLWIRPLDSLSAQALPGTEGAAAPFWSSDGHSLGFFADGKLKRIDLTSSPPRVLYDHGFVSLGGAWNQDDVILASGADGRLFRVPATGGERTAVTELDPARGEVWHSYPAFLPDGTHFLYSARSYLQQNDAIYLGSLVSRERKLLVTGANFATYSPPGFLLFARGGTLMAQPFDLKALQLAGNAIPLVQGIWTTMTQRSGAFSISENGVLVYRSVALARDELGWYDRRGKKLAKVADGAHFWNPNLSPDGKKLAVGVGEAGHRDIWVYDVARGTKSRLTFDPSDHTNPTWSPDGARIFFTSDRRGERDLYRLAANGVGGPEWFFTSGGAKNADDISSDGRYLAYDTGFAGGVSNQIWVLPLYGQPKPIPLLQGSHGAQARFSPNAHYIAYCSDESGTYELYVRSFPDLTGKWEISTDGGLEPMWRADGKELFYISGGKLMSVEVKSDSTSFEAGVPKALFEHPPLQGLSQSFRSQYVVSADGDRFLFNASFESQTAEFYVLTDWTELLKK